MKTKYILEIDFDFKKEKENTFCALTSSENYIETLEREMRHKGINEVENALDSYFMARIAKICGINAFNQLQIKIK